jgi:hypothetical protein
MFTDEELIELEMVLNTFSIVLAREIKGMLKTKKETVRGDFASSEIMLSLCEKYLEKVRKQ